MSYNAAVMDKATFRRLWSGLPHTRVDKSFWIGLENFCGPFFDTHAPFFSNEFFTVAHSGRILQEELHLVDPSTVESCKKARAVYDNFTLWNPLALSALLSVSVNIVIEQLLLAVEQKWVTTYFVVSCRSCACDIARFRTVNDIPFIGTFHATNAFRCPMCTDRTEVNELQDVTVFFQLEKLPQAYQSAHYRLYYSAEAEKRRLETFFCPAGAGFAFEARLPRGRYLISAPFMGAFVEVEVETSAEVLTEKEPFVTRILDMKNYIRSQNSEADPFGRPIKRRSTTAALSSVAAARRAVQRFSIFPGSAAQLASFTESGAATNESGSVSDGAQLGFGAEDVQEAPPLRVLMQKHGKLHFRIFNSTTFSGFLDLYIAMDTRTEFSASPYPQLFRLPHFLHCLPRGLRSSLLTYCVPRAPSTTPTTGVYVRHNFVLSGDGYDDPSIIMVLREVHRYSLEDHDGLLINVSSGGTCFVSSFLTVTAALASSICFFQRVLTRLGEEVALTMRCSITVGPLKIAAYQGVYNDAENIRSSYPDVQFVGPVAYASDHPPIAPPYLRCDGEGEAPREVRRSEDSGALVGAPAGQGVRRFISALDKYRSVDWYAEETTEVIAPSAAAAAAATGFSNGRRSSAGGEGVNGNTAAGGANSLLTGKGSRKEMTTECFVRFEIRECGRRKDSVSAASMQTAAAKRMAARCPQGMTDTSQGKTGPHGILPYFLEYLCEHFEGTRVTEEPHALVVQVPLPMMNAAVQVSTLLDKRSYMESYAGPF